MSADDTLAIILLFVNVAFLALLLRAQMNEKRNDDDDEEN